MATLSFYAGSLERLLFLQSPIVFLAAANIASAAARSTSAATDNKFFVSVTRSQAKQVAACIDRCP